MNDLTTDRLAVLVAATLLLAGCTNDNDPVSRSSTDNSQIPIDKMFTHEGCTIYRFDDAGHYHYWADCRGSVSSTQTCGRNCTHEDGVPTL